MKKLIALICLFMSMNVMAQTEPIVVDLWPNGAPNDNGLSGEEQHSDAMHVSNVSKPQMYVYPAEKPNGMVIIQCPGGAYMNLAIEKEGHSMANWMNHQGITYVVLKYRLPNGHFETSVSDVLESVKIMRQHTQDWKVNPALIGVMGCSAGGNLAIQAATQYTGAADKPNFSVLIYAFTTMNPFINKIMFGENAPQSTIDKYSVMNNITADTPPAFITCSADDNTVPCDDSIMYFQALRKFKTPATLHIYPTGSHGWGYAETFLYKREWTAELEKWLREVRKGL